jgi:hypothetical protein
LELKKVRVEGLMELDLHLSPRAVEISLKLSLKLLSIEVLINLYDDLIDREPGHGARDEATGEGPWTQK